MTGDRIEWILLTEILIIPTGRDKIQAKIMEEHSDQGNPSRIGEMKRGMGRKENDITEKIDMNTGTKIDERFEIIKVSVSMANTASTDSNSRKAPIVFMRGEGWSYTGWAQDIHCNSYCMRTECRISLNIDIVGLAETHLINKKGISIVGYTWFGHTRTILYYYEVLELLSFQWITFFLTLLTFRSVKTHMVKLSKTQQRIKIYAILLSVGLFKKKCKCLRLYG